MVSVFVAGTGDQHKRVRLISSLTLFPNIGEGLLLFSSDQFPLLQEPDQIGSVQV